MIWFARAAVALLCASAVIVAAVAIARKPPEAGGGEATSWPSMTAVTKRPVAVVIGGSIAAGAGASTAADRWASILARTRGWDEVDLAVIGGGYVTTDAASCTKSACGDARQAAAEAVALKPTIVIVSGGESEPTDDADQLRAAIAGTYQALRSGLPSALLIAVGPMSTSPTAQPQTLMINAMVHSASTAVGATFVDMISPTSVLQPGMLAANDVDVNDAGNAAIAARIASSLD